MAARPAGLRRRSSLRPACWCRAGTSRVGFGTSGSAASLGPVNTPPVRFAIVSPARWGRLLLDAARASPALAFAGVWSRSGDNREAVAAGYGGVAYPTFDALLADPGVEAVVLPTPHFLHHPQAMAEFTDHLDGGVFLRRQPLTLDEIEPEFDRLVARHTAREGFRTYDVLHVSTARTMGCKRFVTFDTRARALARLEGLITD